MSLGLLIISFGNTYLHAMIGLAFLGMTQGLAMTIGELWPNYYGTKIWDLLDLYQHQQWCLGLH